MQDRPTAVELLQAVRQFLDEEIAPELSGRKRFHMLIVHNVLGILERELDHEDAAVRAEWTRLAAVLDRGGSRPEEFRDLASDVRAMNAELGARIRAGEVDARWTQTLQALRETVADKLAIANPRYSGGGGAAT